MKMYDIQCIVFFTLWFLAAFCLVSWLHDDAHAAERSKWSGYVQASVYGGADEPWETRTATGKRITSKTSYVAVPASRIVTKGHWKKMGKRNKMRYFYYGERLQLKHGRHKTTVRVEDCGGFAGYGTYRKGKWVPRLFDLTPRVKRALHVNGLGLVKFRYYK